MGAISNQSASVRIGAHPLFEAPTASQVRDSGVVPALIFRRFICRLLVGASLILFCFLLTSTPASAQVTVTISPATTNLPVSGTQQFTATVAGTSNTMATWSVLEGAQGGSITAAGLYTAPPSPGAYYVVATSQADSSQSAAAAVAVPGFLIPDMRVQRASHTAALLQDGTVLLVGGMGDVPVLPAGNNGSIASAEIYDPNTNTFALTQSMLLARCCNAMALLNNGKVLVAGGQAPVAPGQYGSSTAEAELYDPVSGSFSVTGSMEISLEEQTGTTLLNGQVLITGGVTCSTTCAVTGTAELYDPTSGTFSYTGSMTTARTAHTATLLPSGEVLIAGGTSGGDNPSYFASTEIYNPATGTFTPGPSMSTPRDDHTATLLSGGQVLLAGGYVGVDFLASADIYDSVTNTISPTGNLNVERFDHTASLLQNGQVLIAGGVEPTSEPVAAELYDPTSGTFALTGPLNNPRYLHTATALGNGDVIVTGGADVSGIEGSAELYNPTSGVFTTKSVFLKIETTLHTQTTLPDGRILVAGGINCTVGPCPAYTSAELYDPGTGQFSYTGSMNNGRQAHTATLLNTGKVLVVGGWGGVTSPATFSPALGSAELFDPATGTFSLTGSLITPRAFHAATLLSSGQVLITGGLGANGALSSAEIYDPASGTFSAAGNMTALRYWHTATLLNSGQVLIAGGAQSALASPAFLNTAELFDPSTGSFTPTSLMPFAPMNHTATLLGNGQVLIGNGALASQYYDPTSGQFFAAGTPNATASNYRTFHTASILPNGQVLLAGGLNAFSLTTDIYDPVANVFVVGDDLRMNHTNATATALLNGNIVIVGGTNSAGDTSDSGLPAGVREVDIYQSPNAVSAVTLSSITPGTLTGFNPVVITIAGSGFLPNAVATLDSTPLVTSYVSASELTAIVPASEMILAGDHGIVASNFGGVSSTSLPIVIQNALVTITPQDDLLNFVNEDVGNPSEAQSVTIDNSGNLPLVLGSISVTGTNPSDFAISPASTCAISGGSLQPGTSCLITVTFDPAVSGALSAQISVTNNAQQSPVAISLVGNGIASTAISLSASSLSFGNQQIGTTSPPQIVTLTNVGDLPLLISGINTGDGGPFSETNNCPSSLAANANCTINVTFIPTYTGLYNGHYGVEVNDNAPSTFQTIPLTGTGTDLTVGAASGGSTSATVSSGQTATFNLQTLPTAFSGTVTLSANCSSVPAATCNVTPSSANVTPAAPTPFSISVTTTPYTALTPLNLFPRQNLPPALSQLSLSPFRALFILVILALLSYQLRRTRKKRLNVLATAAVLVFLAALAGCGGGSSGNGGNGSPQGTPPNTYTIVVTASAQGTSRTLNLNLTVQ